jgi:hypothetical protein
MSLDFSRRNAMTTATPVSAKSSLESVLGRLLRAGEAEIPAIVDHLPERQRAELALFCYSRAHLHQIGVAIAATCELPFLIQAAPSTAAGHGIFEQSRNQPKRAASVATGSRSRITLAKSASGSSDLASIIASIASEDAPEYQPA